MFSGGQRRHDDIQADWRLTHAEMTTTDNGAEVTFQQVIRHSTCILRPEKSLAVVPRGSTHHQSKIIGIGLLIPRLIHGRNRLKMSNGWPKQPQLTLISFSSIPNWTAPVTTLPMNPCFSRWRTEACKDGRVGLTNKDRNDRERWKTEKHKKILFLFVKCV